MVNSAAGNGCAFILKAQPIMGTSPDKQISDVIRLFGQSSTTTRTYGTPIQVAGPSRIQAWATPESSATIMQRASFDFYDQ